MIMTLWSQNAGGSSARGDDCVMIIAEVGDVVART